jgi:hypothetical protein
MLPHCICLLQAMGNQGAVETLPLGKLQTLFTKILIFPFSDTDLIISGIKFE